jgi:hypothetical protein
LGADSACSGSPVGLGGIPARSGATAAAPPSSLLSIRPLSSPRRRPGRAAAAGAVDGRFFVPFPCSRAFSLSLARSLAGLLSIGEWPRHRDESVPRRGGANRIPRRDACTTIAFTAPGGGRIDENNPLCKLQHKIDHL